MYSLTLRIFDRTVRVETDVEAACQYLSHVFRLQPDRRIGGRTMGLTLVGPDRQNPHYRLFYDSRLHRVLPGADRAILELEHALLSRAVGETEGLTVFHAAWVGCRHNAYILAGEGGAGKSCLSYRLLQRGMWLGSDEAAGFQNKTGFLLPFHRKLMFKSQDEPFSLAGGYSSPIDDRYYVMPPGNPPRWGRAGPYRLFFIFPRFDPKGPGLEVRPLSVLDSVQRLLANCFRLNAIDQRLFRRLVHACEPGRCWLMDYSDGSQAADFIHELGRSSYAEN